MDVLSALLLVSRSLVKSADHKFALFSFPELTPLTLAAGHRGGAPDVSGTQFNPTPRSPLPAMAKRCEPCSSGLRGEGQLICSRTQGGASLALGYFRTPLTGLCKKKTFHSDSWVRSPHFWSGPTNLRGLRGRGATHLCL
jgi:hypothetical protein